METNLNNDLFLIFFFTKEGKTIQINNPKITLTIEPVILA